MTDIKNHAFAGCGGTALNARTQEAEAGGPQSSGSAWSTKPSPGYISKALLQRNPILKTKTKNPQTTPSISQPGCPSPTLLETQTGDYIQAGSGVASKYLIRVRHVMLHFYTKINTEEEKILYKNLISSPNLYTTKTGVTVSTKP